MDTNKIITTFEKSHKWQYSYEKQLEFESAQKRRRSDYLCEIEYPVECDPYELFPNRYDPVDNPAPTILKRALWLGHLGYKIFPLRGISNHNTDYGKSKEPIIEGGCKSASNDVEFIGKFFAFPGVGIGIACLDYLLGIDIDVDKEKGIDGFEDLAYIQNRYGIVLPAPIVKTPRGGGHIVVNAPADYACLKGRTHIIFDGRKTAIDIRVGNQYLVAPGTIVPSPFNPNEQVEYVGEYPPVTKLQNLDKVFHRFIPRQDSLVTVPGWSANMDAVADTASDVTTDTVSGAAFPDSPFDDSDRPNQPEEVISRVREALNRLPESIEGEGGSSVFLQACNIIFYGFGLNYRQGRPLLDEFNETKAKPRWEDEKEIQHKIAESVTKPVYDRPIGFMQVSSDDYTELIEFSQTIEAEKEQQSKNPFPIDVLDDICHELKAIALGFNAETYFPTSYVVLPGIAAFSSLLGNCHFLDLGVNRVEPGTIWGVCFGEPSSGKSPGWKHATSPYLNINNRIKSGEIELSATCPPVKKPKPGRPKNGEPEFEEVPVKPNYLLTRFTTPGLIENLIKNSRGLLVSNDEMAVIWKRINNGGGDDGSFDQFNSFWTGSPQVDVTKTSASFDGQTEHYIDKSYFAMIGTTQPENLRQMKALSIMWSSGHMVRYLVAYPPKPNLPDDFSPLPLSFVVHDDYCGFVNHAFENLYKNADSKNPTIYKLNDDAQARFAEFELNIRRRGEKETNNKKRQYLSKLPTHVARLTLVLHLMKRVSNQRKGVSVWRTDIILKDVLEVAIRIGEWSYREFCRLVDYLEGKEVRGSAKNDSSFIIQLLRQNGGKMTKRALRQRTRFKKHPELLKQAIDELVALGAVRIDVVRSANGKDKITFILI